MTNKTAQFTPGPWVVTEHSAGMICVAGPDHKDLCAVGYNRTEGRNDVANATLIAAAPVMYAIIKDMREAFYVKGTRKALLAVMERSRDVIAQAEGRQA